MVIILTKLIFKRLGTTTLFWLLSQDKKGFLSNLNDSQEQPAKPALPLKKEGKLDNPHPN